MKRVLLLVAVVLLLGACLPFPNVSNPTPAVDIAATNQANLQTAVAQTLAAQPTPTSVPFTDTATLPVESPTIPVTDTPLPADPLLNNLTTTPATETSGPEGLTATPALAAAQPTATWTLAVRTYGTLPPQVPFGRIILVNKAKAEAYISLHVDLNGSNTVIEYPVQGTKSIQAPIGFYRYVAWVGGREMVGEFRLKRDHDLTIVLYKDRVEIK